MNFGDMVEIKDISGKVLFSVLPNEQSKSVEELMNSDYIQLSWMSDKGTPIPLSAYIECNGEKYTLHEPYTPIRQDECTYQYAPQFQSRIMNWSKQITPIYTYEEDGRTVKSRDMDWDFTGSPADAMYIIKQAIKNETGEDWTVQLSDSLPATITISSQSSSIFSILNSIASECKTEWWADKKTNTLYLSKCIFGESITLEVGNNVQVPSVATDNEGYYTRFYAFGSTRNIVQGPTQSGAVVNNRLTLDPVKYPNGYKDIREGLKQNEIFVKVLYFDEIYPSSKLTISDVRARLRYRLDNAGQKIQIGGTEEEPVYEQYAIWYFQIADFSFNADMIIEGKKLSVSFGTGQLASRDFELAYHEKTETVSDANDVTPFEVKAGDYEIIIDETSGQIIPGVAYIIPQNGDSVILYNIQMPAEYTASAQAELEKELDKAMAYYTEDNNSYQIQSDPTWFYTNKTDISMGQAVTFINGTKSLSTRVLMVEKRLDLPCYQTIKVGNKVIKGNTQQLKDEVASANQNIDVIQAFNELSASLSQAYANAQREMIEGFAAIKNLWTLETDENGEKYAYTKYNVLTQGGVTQYSAGNSKVPSVFDGLPLDNQTIWKNPESGLIEVIGGTGTSFDENAMWSALSGSSNNQINKSHLTTVLAEYATAESVSALTTELNKKWTQDDTKIKNWDTAFGWGDHSKAGYAHLANEEAFTGLKHFTAGLSVGESKKKIYEENGVVYIDADVAVTGAMTFYASAGRSVSTIMDGVTVDEETITKGSDNVLRIKNAGAGSSFDENAMWSALSGSSDNQINKSHLTNALAGYATESWVTGKGYATESWVASKNYATTEALNAVSNKLNDFLEGSDADTIINKWKELEAFLSGMAETDNLAEILETKADKKYVDSTFVTLATKQTITGEKTFSSVLNTAAIKASGAITAPSLAASDWVTIAGIKLRKLEDGALILEGNLALTGALTMYATGAQGFDTIYDGLPIDNDTIYWSEVEGSKVLKAKEGSGSSFDKSAMWAALEGATTEQINKTHLTTALNGYATESWVTSKNYLTSVSIATISDLHANWDALLKAAPSAYVTRWPTISEVTDRKNLIIKLNGGSTEGTNLFTYNVTGEKTINITPAGIGAAASSHNHSWSNITSGKPSTLSGYGITDAYTKTESDSKYPTKTGSGASGTWGINVTGNAGTATKLQTARSLWGNNFDGTANISGDITLAIGKGIYLSANDERWLLQTKRSDNTQINGIKTNGFQMCTYFGDTKTMQFSNDRIYSYVDFRAEKDLYINGIRLHKTSDGVITLEGNLAVTGGITTYAIDPVSASTIMDGVVVDGVTIKKENGKLVAVGGGEAGSVAWGNISGKPSVFPTNIVNITDLHSSWDAVLKAQKPNWLTAVSIATISDLHANWDALLKAAPSAYVTRWPTISEVTGKQNLIVKLNGGTTEGTNQFTYNATGAKTINITPVGIGAYTKSESDSKYPTKTGSGASGTWGIGITGNAATASKWATARTITLGSYLSGSVSLDGSANVTLNANVIGLTSQGKKAAVSGTTFQEVGVRLYEVFENGYPTNYGNLLSVRGGGCGELLLAWKDQYSRIYYRSKADSGNDSWTNWNTVAFLTDNIASATKLQTARTLWGQSFNGEKNVSGNLSNVGNIVPSSDNTYTLGNATNHFEGAYVRVLRNNINREMIIAQNAANNLVFQTSGVNRIIISSYGEVGIGTTSPSYKLHVNGNVAVNTGVNVYGMTGSSWGAGNGAYEIQIPTNSQQTPILLAYDINGGRTGTSRYFSIEILNQSNRNVRMLVQGQHVIELLPSKVTILKDLLVEGGGTFYSSDIRYKSIMQQVNLSLLDIANAPSFVYRWNKKGMKRDRLNLGGSAQYTQSVLPWAVEDNDNFLSMDYATVAYTFAVHTARHLLTYESRTDKKIKKLEREIVILKKQLKKLGYEEVRTLDDSGI